jgi:hypothetical protein
VPSDNSADSFREDQVRYAPPPVTQQLIDELSREEVLAARAMSGEEKFLAGEELFNYACAITLGGIRNQYPELSEAEHRRILEERLALADRLEEQRVVGQQAPRVNP